jgi:hypothetical protein
MHLVAQRAQVFGLGRQAFRIGRVGHVGLVLQPLFRRLERAGQVEDLLAVLDGRHPPGGEGAAVARPLDLVEHRGVHVAGPDEIGVQRVADAVGHGLVGGHQGLGDDQAAEDPGKPSLGLTPRNRFTSMGSRSRISARFSGVRMAVG